jgi:hypothetical protein
MQDASMRSQMGLEEQSALHFAQAKCSVIPACGAWSGTDAFSGAEESPGAARQLACLALILMGDWCGLLNEPDTTETKTRMRKHQAL